MVYARQPGRHDNLPERWVFTPTILYRLVLFGVSGNLWLRHGKRGSVSLFSRLLLARLGVGKKKKTDLSPPHYSSSS